MRDVHFRLPSAGQKRRVLKLPIVFCIKQCKSSRFREQRWYCGESTRLPQMLPGFDSQAWRHAWIKFVSSLLCTDSRESTEKLIHAFVSSRIDYCNSLLFGLPAYQIHKIQRVQNAAARLIYNESKYCRISLLLYNLHWLPVTFRIEFKFYF